MRILSALLCGLFLLAVFTAKVYKIQTRSMLPAIAPGDYVLVSKWAGKYDSGDIIAFERETDGRRFVMVKRVVAAEGDTLWVGTEGVSSRSAFVPHDPECVWLRGRKDPGTKTHTAQDEWVPGSSYSGCVELWRILGDRDIAVHPLKKGGLFVAGDNYSESEDSRHFGPINAEKVTGKVIAIF